MSDNDYYEWDRSPESEIRSTPSQVIGRLLDAVGQFEGRDGIESIVRTGYRGEVSRELLELYEGDENAARRAVQRLAAARAEEI